MTRDTPISNVLGRGFQHRNIDRIGKEDVSLSKALTVLDTLRQDHVGCYGNK